MPLDGMALIKNTAGILADASQRSNFELTREPFTTADPYMSNSGRARRDTESRL